MNWNKYVLATFFIFLSSFAWTQDEEEDFSPPPKKGYRYDFMVDMGVPHYVYNPANARAFEAIGNVGAGFHVKLFKNFSIGPMLRFTGFNIYNPRFNQSNPLNLTFIASLDIKYEVNIGSQFAYIPAVNAGVGVIYYNNLLPPPKGVDHQPPSTLVDWGAIVNLNNGFYYYVRPNKRVGVGLIVGATYFSHEFKLKDTGLLSDEALYNLNDDGPSINISVGFGFVANFGKID